MKRWMKLTALTVAVLNLLMLVASVYPVSTVGLAYAGNDQPTLKAVPIGGDQPDLSFWRDAWNCIKCIFSGGQNQNACKKCPLWPSAN